jgi:hypothetical protein
MDDSVDGKPEAAELGKAGPRFYIHDPKRERIVIIGTGNDVLDWCVDRETDIRDEQTARGLVPTPETTDGENGLYHEPTAQERRAAILRIGDANAAINHTLGSLHAIYGCADCWKPRRRIGILNDPSALAAAARNGDCVKAAI